MILSIMNEKGGVGKTTTSINLAYMLANKNKKVLLIDYDNQGNSTIILSGYDTDKINTLEYTIYDIMNASITGNPYPNKNKYIIKCKNNIQLLPANYKFTNINNMLVNSDFREMKLKEYIETIKDDYDYIIIDCKPEISTLLKNVMMVSDYVIIPSTATLCSVQGLNELLKNLIYMAKTGNRNLKIAGILINMEQKNTKIHKKIIKELNEMCGSIINIFETKIPFSIKVSEGELNKKCICEYLPSNAVSIAYNQWLNELEKLF